MMQSLFAISRNFKKKLGNYRDFQAPAGRVASQEHEAKEKSISPFSEDSSEYDSEALSEALEDSEKIKNIGQDKINWKINNAIKKEVQMAGLSYFPDIVQLTIDDQESSIWYFHNKAYEKANSVVGLDLSGFEDTNHANMVDYVNELAADKDYVADLLIGDFDNKQMIFLKQPTSQRGLATYKQSEGLIMPVSMNVESIMRLSRKYQKNLKSLGAMLESDFDYEDVGGTQPSAQDVVRPSGSAPIDIPVEWEQYTPNELEWIRRVLLFVLKDPRVQSSPDYMKTLVELHSKTQTLIEDV